MPLTTFGRESGSAVPVDWAERRRQYDLTVVDWARLNPFAQRVARSLAETSDAASWSLEQRNWSRKDTLPKGVVEESISFYNFELLRDGSLVQRIRSWTELLVPRTGFSKTDETERVVPFDEHTVMLFDFEREYRKITFPKTVVWSGVEPGRKLITHAKGVGLSKRLKLLLPAEGGPAARAS